ncbi:MAG TPA: FAD/NAD(P)-binding protein [Gammaproteobacteria bacterium]|nr:FAD/NAD(P)-binding protein [Gammaproteobacteria bacterium]
MSANAKTFNPYLPQLAAVVERVDETRDVFTLRLRLHDAQARAAYRFQPGQFNMLYLWGVGEVAISIVSDPDDLDLIDHTIRAVGRVTRGLQRLKPGDKLGLRGPFGRGWPLEAAQGRHLLLITGGLGCAPTTSMIHYALQRRASYGRVTVCHGVKHPDDLIYTDRIQTWCAAPDTQVMLTADKGTPEWRGRVGLVTQTLEDIDPIMFKGMAMMCGPEPMMVSVAEDLLKRGMALTDIYLSMERNMQCAVGHCGHCQFGGKFICKDGPVFPYAQLRALLAVKGF